MSEAFAYKRDVALQARLSAEVLSLLKVAGNTECADCAATRTVRFCSVTLGVFLCNRCYAIHRSVGAHVTRTKCVGLDFWAPDELERLRAVGNLRSNALYEATVPEGLTKPTAVSTDKEAERWIRDKYARRRYSHVGGVDQRGPAHAEGALTSQLETPSAPTEAEPAQEELLIQF